MLLLYNLFVRNLFYYLNHHKTILQVVLNISKTFHIKIVNKNNVSPPPPQFLIKIYTFLVTQLLFQLCIIGTLLLSFLLDISKPIVLKKYLYIQKND